MYEIKKQIFLNLTKNQKSALCNYLRALMKKSQPQSVEEANKAFEKKKREFLREVKMSKESPTKKQLYYYERLCKKYGLEKKELSSKLEARDEIDRIIKEHDTSNLYQTELQEEE